MPRSKEAVGVQQLIQSQRQGNAEYIQEWQDLRATGFAFASASTGDTMTVTACSLVNGGI